ncbi:MAG: SMC-Scp complex subunit ScpB [Neisseria sp.]|nr:SMC-Scp complex subunit ScpB [Neisseria sp.]
MNAPECIIEAALLTASEPLSGKQLRQLFSPELTQDKLNDALENLSRRWTDRALILSESAQGWRFAAQEAVARQIPHLYEEKSPRYSRAVLETLAIIAYRQPVTRGDIEAVRGVAVSSQIMQTLSERGWIESIGQKDTPGRPSLWATTGCFLHDLRLNDLSELPSLDELGELLATEEILLSEDDLTPPPQSTPAE